MTDEIRIFDTGVGLIVGTILTYYQNILFSLVTSFTVLIIWYVTENYIIKRSKTK